MLSNLIVKNFAIIEDLSVNFTKGFSVLTGETGAGKSIIIDALSLLLGERSSFNKIRHDAKQAYIEGVFEVERKQTVEEINELVPALISDDHLLVVTRVLDESGRSRLQMNGRTLTLSLSKQIMPKLIDIHSQHENITLLDEKKHLTYLDAFLKEADFVEFNLAYKDYEYALKNLTEVEGSLLSESELDFIKFQVDEISRAKINDGELEQLENIASQLKNLDKIATSKAKIEQLLTSEQGALTNLYLASNEFATLGENYEEIAQSLKSTYYDLQSKIEEQLALLDDLFTESRSLDEVMQRIYLIRRIIAKHGGSEASTLEAKVKMSRQIELALAHESELNKAKKQVEQSKLKALEAANKLSKIRQKTALQVENKVNSELKSLALDKASFKIEFASVNLTKTGVDDVYFALAANVGSPYLAIKDAISGGEASRLMLALKLVFKNLGSAETLIFDE